MTSEIRISTQYYENYGELNNPNWKPKGEQIFILNVDSDYFYFDERAIETIKEMLEKQSNRHYKFEYLSYEIQFQTATILDSNEFEAIFVQPMLSQVK